VHEPVPRRLGVRGRRQEPRGAAEEVGVRVLGAARLGARERVAADEPRRAIVRSSEANFVLVTGPLEDSARLIRWT
jgi:hypothetical protein